MSACRGCGGLESAGASLAVCDNCQLFCCFECSGLTATEIRAVTLKSRVIKFFCPGCNAVHRENAGGGAVMQEAVNVEEGLLSVLNVAMRTLHDKISNLELQFKRLEEVNTELLTVLVKKPEHGNDTEGEKLGKGAEIAVPACVNSYAAKLKAPKVRSKKSLTTDLKNLPSPPGPLEMAVRLTATGDNQTGSRLQHGASIVQSNGKDGTLGEDGDAAVNEKVGPACDGVPSGVALGSAGDSLGDSGGWRVVRHGKRRVRPKPVSGSNENDDTLEVAQKMHWFFVSGLKPTVEPQAIVDFLKKHHFDKDCSCVKMNTKKSNQFGSFKLCVPTDYKDKILDPALWPRGVKVNHFLNVQRHRAALP